jgi:hypothetical protein
MDGTLDYVIEAICDDPRHARGKVAKIETFRRYDDPLGGSLWRASHIGRHASGREPYTCKLCRMSLVCNEDTLQRLLGSVWARRAELQSAGLLTPAPRTRTNVGAWRVSLRTLKLVASNLLH